jgi:hypothetical protein
MSPESNANVFRITRQMAIERERAVLPSTVDFVVFEVPSDATHVQSEDRDGTWSAVMPLIPESKSIDKPRRYLLLSDEARRRIEADTTATIHVPGVRETQPCEEWDMDDEGNFFREFTTVSAPRQIEGSLRRITIAESNSTGAITTHYRDVMQKMAIPFDPENKVTHVDLGGES